MERSSGPPPLHRDATLLHPERIGPYRVIARIASGGMAEIYLARRRGEAGFQRVVVIKRMLPHLAMEPELRTTLLDEARLMARLRHPNIVGVQEFRRDTSDFYLVMEYLRGESLAGLRQELIGRGEHMHPALAVHIVAEICAGLHAAHELRDDRGDLLNVVHRDVSPQNVFVTFDGEVKIIDFGIACFDDRAGRTRTGLTKGKFAYMSPEQFAGERIDRRADVFAVGAMLHELLTGKRLFARESDAHVLRAVLHDPIPLPSQIADDSVLIPEALDTICMKALARDRNERFATAHELREKLRELMPTLDPRQRARERLVEMTRRVLPRRFAETEALMRRAINDTGETEAPEEPSWLTGDIALGAGPTRRGPGADASLARVERTPSARPSRSRRPPPRDHGPLWLASFAVVTACAVMGIGVWLAVRTTLSMPAASLPVPDQPPLTAATAAPAPVALPPVTPVALPPAPPAPARVHVTIESTPAGARVSIGGEIVGTTPLEHELARDSTGRTIVLEREGYAEFTTELTPETDQRLVVRLTPVRARAPAPRRGRPRFYSFD